MITEKEELIMSIEIPTCSINTSNLGIGDTFALASIKWKILDIDERGYVCLADDKFEDRMQFDSDCNNWTSSDLRKYLNTTLYNQLANVIGKDNIVQFERDLISLDGQTEYGTCVDNVSLISLDEYRKYRKLIPNTDDYWWWTINPDSTPCNNDSRWIRVVSCSGLIHFTHCDRLCGVRPFCIFHPNMFQETATPNLNKLKDAGYSINTHHLLPSAYDSALLGISYDASAFIYDYTATLQVVMNKGLSIDEAEVIIEWLITNYQVKMVHLALERINE